MKNIEEKKYGILMNRYNISDFIYLLKPQYLLAVEEINENDELYYVDSIGIKYSSMHDVRSILTEDNTIGYVISESQLLENFPDCTLENAKMNYFEGLNYYIHIGYFLEDKNQIAVLMYDFVSMLNKLDEMDINSIINLQLQDEKQYDKEENNFFDSIDSGEPTIVMDYAKFMNIYNSTSYEEMKSKLEEIKKAIDLSLNVYENEFEIEKSQFLEELTGNHIIDLFNSVYETLLSIDEIELMKKSIKQIQDVYTELTLKLDEKGMHGFDVTEANNLLYSLVDKYDELLKSNNLDSIKKGIKEIKLKEFKNIKKVADTCDKINLDEEKNTNKEDLNKKFEELFGAMEDKEKILNVKEMKNFFDKKIIGQEDAKKDVISSIVMNGLSDNPLDKNSCLLVGPTGSGKTLIAETVSEYLDMPMEVIDTTQLTAPGYVGANIEDFLVRLLVKTKGDLKKAETGIVVFDEIDKKGSEKNEDVSGKGVLNTLLPFLQGTTYNVKYNNKTIPFDTSKLTIFATGAFTDVALAKSKNGNVGDYKNTNIGFNSELNSKNELEEDIKYEKLEIDDFVKYGNMPIELMGRFTTIAQLSGHTKESLKSILVNSNISALLAEKNKLSKLGIDVKWTEGYLDAVAQAALKLKTGGRSLKKIVEQSIKVARWEVMLDLENYKGILLTEKAVEDNYECMLIDNDGVFTKVSDLIQINNQTENSKTLKLQK